MGTDATYCWRDSYGRGAGSLPKSCPSGKELIADGVLCYDKCDVKFGNEFYRYGYDCHQRCKSGWDDHGLLCHKANWGRGVGTADCGFDATLSSALGGGRENHTTNFRRLLGGGGFFGLTCGGHHCTRQNKQDCLGLCYPKCPSSHPDWIGCNLCGANCKSSGYHGGTAPSCTKKVYTSPGIEGAQCQNGWEMDAGLCYEKCKAGYRGAGPVCWGTAPKVKTSSGDIKQFIECGMGAATDDAECAAVTADQILGPLEVVAFVATAGSSSTAAMGAKGAARASAKVADAGSKMNAVKRYGADLRKAFKDDLKDNVKGFDEEDTADLFEVLDTMTKVTTETDAIRAAAELAALVDPTGISGTVAAFAHDLCTRIMVDTTAALDTSCTSEACGKGSGTWTRINGNLGHISSNGVWVWGTQSDGDIFKCREPCSGKWEKVNGGLKQVDVGGDYVWGVSSSNAVYKQRVDGSDGKWTRINGNLGQISSNGVWVWGTQSDGDIFKCREPCSGKWEKVNGGLKQVDVGGDHVWGVSSGNAIYKQRVDGSDGKWTRINGNLGQISSNGVWVWGTQSDGDIFKCREPCSGKWEKVNGGLKQVDVANEVWGVSSGNAIYKQ